jgi:hypothetical protein
VQRKGSPIAEIFGSTVYHITAAHSDEPPAGGWMLLLEGKKRFFLLPYESAQRLEEESGRNVTDASKAIFTEDAIIELAQRKFGLVVVELVADDVLYFPSHWYHEVHNLTPDSLAITGAVLNPVFLAMTLHTLQTTPTDTLHSVKVNLMRGAGRLREAFEALPIGRNAAHLMLGNISTLCHSLITTFQEKEVKAALTKLGLQQLTPKE